MTTITKEEVKAFIEQIESDLANGWEAQIFELKLARIALASLEAEPIGAFTLPISWWAEPRIISRMASGPSIMESLRYMLPRQRR